MISDWGILPQSHSVMSQHAWNCVYGIVYYDCMSISTFVYTLTSSYTCMIFLSRFRLIEFFDDHGLYHGLYSPWSEREIWPFLKVAISPKPEWPRQSKLVCMHLTSSYTCMIFLSRFRSIEFYGLKGKFGRF